MILLERDSLTLWLKGLQELTQMVMRYGIADVIVESQRLFLQTSSRLENTRAVDVCIASTAMVNTTLGYITYGAP